MGKPRCFEVVSPTYSTGGWGWNCEPPEETVDYVMVRTTTKRRARTLAVRFMRRMMGRGRYFATVDGDYFGLGPPMAYLKVYELPIDFGLAQQEGLAL